jgi:hypothetical protein
LLPSPGDKDQAFGDEKLSHPSVSELQLPLLLYLTWSTPDPRSFAVIVRATDDESVKASPLFIVIEPVGEVVSKKILSEYVSGLGKKESAHQIW